MRIGKYALILLGLGLVLWAQTPIIRGPGQMLVLSDPSNLLVSLTKHDKPPKSDILRYRAAEEEPRGSTPLLIDLNPGDYTVAVQRVFPAGAPEMKEVPRGCISGLQFSGGNLFFDCFKCSFYGDKTYTDPIDPYERDGNVGVCFDAPGANKPVRYFRLYPVTKGSDAVTVRAKFQTKKRK